MTFSLSSKRGISLGNVIIGITLFLIMTTAIGALSITLLKGVSIVEKKTQAIFLAKEGLEIMRHIHESSQHEFKTFIGNTDYGDALTISSPPSHYSIGFHETSAQNTYPWKVERKDISLNIPLYKNAYNLITVQSEGITKTPFQRYVTLQYMKEDPLTQKLLPTDEISNIIQITCSVGWESIAGMTQWYNLKTFFHTL
jgi:hypothetical protein